MLIDKVSAIIGLREKSGNISTIKVLYNGNPYKTGTILIAKYQNVVKIKELLSLGNLYLLGERIKPSKSSHYVTYNGRSVDWSTSQDCVTVSIDRDVIDNSGVAKNESNATRVYPSIEAIYKATKIGIIYIYDEIEGRWDTYGKERGSKQLQWVTSNAGYLGLIKNLSYREELSDLSSQEWQQVRKNLECSGLSALL